MPFSTFYRLKPKDVYLIGDIPDKDCLCKHCLNYVLLVRAIHKYKIKEVSNSPKDMIKMTLCTICEMNVSFNVYPEHSYYDCIQRKCNLCDTKGVFDMLLKENPGIDKDQEELTYRRWKYVEKEKGKKLDIVDEVATKSELLNQYISDLQFMSLHMFNWKWHDQQFQYIKNNLQESHLLQVLGFAQNFMNELGEEPQS